MLLFLKMMELYAGKVYELSKRSESSDVEGSLSYLSAREKDFLALLLQKKLYEFAPIDVSRMLNVSNKTVINRCTALASHGFLIPKLVKTRIRSYQLSDFTKANEKKILKWVGRSRPARSNIPFSQT